MCTLSQYFFNSIAIENKNITLLDNEIGTLHTKL